MYVKQMSVFAENKPGEMAALVGLLADHQVNLRALSVADTQEFGIMRIIVEDEKKAAAALQEGGYVFSITPVLAVPMPDEPGALAKILRVLADAQVNVEYSYAFLSTRIGSACLILRVEDNDRAAAVLGQAGIHTAGQEELFCI